MIKLVHLSLARHGQTNYNELKLCNADPSVDVHLTKKGHRQAQELATSLKEALFGKILVSELKRTRQTAAYINRFHHLAIQVDKRLNDNRTGYEGRPAAEYYAALKSAQNMWTVRFNGGESLQDTHARMQQFLDDLQLQQVSSVLIVTSEIIIQVMYNLIQQVPDQQALDLQVAQGSYLELDI